MTASSSIPVICIDGPTASGKGTVAQEVARQLGWHYLDSGALYRLTALSALNTNTPLADETVVAQHAAQLSVTFKDDRITMDTNNVISDVTDAIRQEHVGNAASKIAALPAVRAALLQRQRDFAQAPGLVADGRDMGTVVFPDAPLKVFLTASVQARAQRRYNQLISKGFSANIDVLLRELTERDARDSNRAAAPLKAAIGAHELDSSSLTVDQVVTQILQWWHTTAA